MLRRYKESNKRSGHETERGKVEDMSKDGNDNNQNNGVLTFDEILSDKFYQSEFDRRVQKAIGTATERINEEHQSQIEQLKAELGTTQGKLKEYEQNHEQYQNTLLEAQKSHAFELAVAKSGVIDDVALKAHLQKFVEEAEFKDGKIEGLAEHIAERLEGDLIHLKPANNKALGGEFKTGQSTLSKQEAEIFKQFKIKE